jgi:hypothetical protein
MANGGTVAPKRRLSGAAVTSRVKRRVSEAACSSLGSESVAVQGHSGLSVGTVLRLEEMALAARSGSTPPPAPEMRSAASAPLLPALPAPGLDGRTLPPPGPTPLVPSSAATAVSPPPPAVAAAAPASPLVPLAGKSMCLRCSKQLVKDGTIRCLRPHEFAKCGRCSAGKAACLPVGTLQGTGDLMLTLF